MKKIIIIISIFLVLTVFRSTIFSQINLTKYLGNPVLDLGVSGSWDDFGVYSPTVIFDGSVYKMWYTGADGTPTGESIGYAISNDGLNWDKPLEEPVLSGVSGSWDSQINYCCVLNVDGQYLMYYTGNREIGLAISEDGENWEKDPNNPVFSFGNPGEWDEQSANRPCVIYDEIQNIYKMWYQGKKWNKPWKIGYATSTNGKDWIKYTDNPIMDNTNHFASASAHSPCVKWDGYQYVMFFGSNIWGASSIGVAFSTDGINWQESPQNPVLPFGPQDDNEGSGPSFILQDNTYKVWYDYYGLNSNNPKIGYAEGNSPPTVGIITAPIDPVAVNTLINTSAPFTDPNEEDTHTAEWDWGDGNISTGIVDESGGSGTVTGSHLFTEAGVYTVTLSVTDNYNASGQSVYQYIVVYDPEAGFVTGGGWINSPEGAYTPDPSITGKANFGFVSKYKKGQSIPDGNTQFHFKVADFKFSSTSYDWLVIAGPNAKYKGLGTVNGEGNFGFILASFDGDLNGNGDDKFRIKIWDKETDEIIYDNQIGDDDDADASDVIEGGSIVIHKDALSKQSVKGEIIEIPTEFALSQNYPNPFNPTTEISFALPKDSEVILSIYNTNGQLVKKLASGQYAAGTHRIIWDATDDNNNRVASGVYLVVMKAGDFIAQNKLILTK